MFWALDLSELSDKRRTFRGSPLWTGNVVAAAVTVFAGGPILTAIVFVALAQHHADFETQVGLTFLLAGSVLLALMAYFPGNLGVFYPTSIEIRTLDLALRAPFKEVSIPIGDLGDIERSAFWQGDVVHLTRPRGALTQFIIPWYFGSERKALIDAIRRAAGQTG